MKVLTSLLLLAPAFALDLILDSITCDEGLPYYATDFDMKCDGQTRCTFGKDAVIYGELVYNGTEHAGVVDSVVYAESGLQFMTLEYKLFEDLPLNMCGKWVLGIEEDAEEEEEAADDAERRRLADAAGDDAAAFDDDYVRDDNCPADGLYAFQVGYTLPAADDVTSWLATGWAGSGEISIFAEKGNSATLVGYCTLKFSTAVTASSSGSMNPPSALVASLIAVAVVLGIVLLCIYCTCCRSKKTAAAAAKNKAAGGGGKYHDDDPIDMARSRSDVDSYQAMDEQAASTKKPWASPF